MLGKVVRRPPDCNLRYSHASSWFGPRPRPSGSEATGGFLHDLRRRAEARTPPTSRARKGAAVAAPAHLTPLEAACVRPIGNALENGRTFSVARAKIELHPAELGMVTASLRLSGEQLSIEIRPENHEAHRRLSSDSDAIMTSRLDPIPPKLVPTSMPARARRARAAPSRATRATTSPAQLNIRPEA